MDLCKKNSGRGMAIRLPPCIGPDRFRNYVI